MIPPEFNMIIPRNNLVKTSIDELVKLTNFDKVIWKRHPLKLDTFQTTYRDFLFVLEGCNKASNPEGLPTIIGVLWLDGCFDARLFVDQECIDILTEAITRNYARYLRYHCFFEDENDNEDFNPPVSTGFKSTKK
jgi:hypothetical protein